MKPTSVSFGNIDCPFLTFLLPCYNESAVVPESYRRVKAAGEAFGKRYEIVPVNDGSRDDTLARMLAFAQRDPAQVIVNLSRNYVHQLALQAGLHYWAGERVLILDADMQAPRSCCKRCWASVATGGTEGSGANNAPPDPRCRDGCATMRLVGMGVHRSNIALRQHSMRGMQFPK